jgi:N-acetylglutamate synthase-like GNAT family acetyltransferase
MTEARLRIQRVGRDACSLATELEPDEPRTTRLVSDLLAYRSWRWRRAWRIDGQQGELAAVLVLAKACFDRWDASVYVRDPASAPLLGRRIDRSIAWSVTGAAADIRPLQPHVRRVKQVLVLPWGTLPYPSPEVLGPPDEHTRAATLLDLGQLMDLYSGYELFSKLTRWQLRQRLRRLIDRHLVIVYERDERIVAAAIIDARTRRYAISTDLTVHPDFRREGIAWEIGKRMEAVDRALAVGASAALATTNPMHRDDAAIRWDPDHLYTLMLGGPRRFKGQTRLRRLYGRIQPLARRPLHEFRDPTNPATPAPSERG